MAYSATTDLNYRTHAEGDSDYGSDFSVEEVELINGLLAGQERAPLNSANPSLEYNERADSIRVPQALGGEQICDASPGESSAARANSATSAPFYSEYSDASQNNSKYNEGVLGSSALMGEKLDTRSPIERFRTAPKRNLSVTDLVSPAWCELHYWYSLKTYGRVIQTKAMKQGVGVHKDLEEQVYTTIAVEIPTKEDAMGLRIWNVIQGLSTLQDIGYTRELEVWGIVDGLVVTGVIDQISFVCPDPELESQLESGQTSSKDKLPIGQRTISDFFKASGGTSISDLAERKERVLSKKIYICDVKTRMTPKLPTGAAFRQTKMQLMLYHYLLCNLATNQVDFSMLLDRFNLDGKKPFSDSFIAQMGNLSDRVSVNPLPDSNADPDSFLGLDSMTLLIENNSLCQLWSYMIQSFQNLLPGGTDSIGNVLKAEYRSRDHGEVLGSNTLAMDDDVLKAHLDHVMKWWKGERKPLGVVIEEAYKCKNCDFMDICDWRSERVAEATENARSKKKALEQLKKWEV